MHQPLDGLGFSDLLLINSHLTAANVSTQKKYFQAKLACFNQKSIQRGRHEGKSRVVRFRDKILAAAYT